MSCTILYRKLQRQRQPDPKQDQRDRGQRTERVGGFVSNEAQIGAVDEQGIE